MPQRSQKICKEWASWLKNTPMLMQEDFAKI
jgi:hypothetical protein